jgi:hypothetical protein
MTRVTEIGAAARIPSTKRVTVVFAAKTYEALQRIAARKTANISEALRQSISLTDFIENEVENGARVLIERDGKMTEIVLR